MKAADDQVQQQPSEHKHVAHQRPTSETPCNGVSLVGR